MMQVHQDHAAAAPDFLPHGFCYLWNPGLLLTHVGSDLLIGLAYVAISISLALLVHRARNDIPFSTVFIWFGLFIVLCGVTHFVEIVTLWYPVYWTAGFVKAFTAVASVATAVTMPRTVPAVLATVRDARLHRARELDAARNEGLEAQNARLAAQAAELEAERVRLADALEQAKSAQAEATRERQRAEEALELAESAQARAEEANAAKAAFLAVMSHELRTPLNAIGGYVDLIDLEIRGPVTLPQRSDLARVRKAQRHLLALIEDVLSFAKIEAGRLEYRADTVPLTAVVEEVLALVGPQVARTTQVLTSQVPTPSGTDDTLYVIGDQEKIIQILLNVLTNAHKYSGDGARIDLIAEAAGDRIAISVRDNGPGIPSDKLAAIFEPFVQVTTGLVRPHEGSGLGLAISRDLARGMNGDLTVTSAPGAGATFTLWLPAEPGGTASGGDGRVDRRADSANPA